MNALQHLPAEIALRRVFNTREAAAYCGLSVVTFRRMHAKKAIPNAIRLSERRLGWRVGDLIEWTDARAAGIEWCAHLAARAQNDNVRAQGQP